MVIDQNVALRVDRQIDAMIVDHLGVQMNAGPSVHATHVHRQIVQLVVHTETATRVHLQIVVRRVIDQPVAHTETEIHVQVLIVHVAKILMVAIAHARAMIATHARLRVTANAVAVQIVPEVVFPMIAKSVHAVALAKSA
jgi:hypothetical protein